MTESVSTLPNKARLSSIVHCYNFCCEGMPNNTHDDSFSYGNKFYLIESPLRYSIAKQQKYW